MTNNQKAAAVYMNMDAHAHAHNNLQIESKGQHSVVSVH